MNSNQKTIEDLDNLIDRLVAECYEVLETSETSNAKQILTMALNNINKQDREPKITQGSGIINRDLVSFDIGDGESLPLYSIEDMSYDIDE